MGPQANRCVGSTGKSLLRLCASLRCCSCWWVSTGRNLEVWGLRTSAADSRPCWTLDETTGGWGHQQRHSTYALLDLSAASSCSHHQRAAGGGWRTSFSPHQPGSVAPGGAAVVGIRLPEASSRTGAEPVAVNAGPVQVQQGRGTSLRVQLVVL